MAAAVGDSGEGAPAASMVWMVPGRAIASSTARNVAWAANTGLERSAAAMLNLPPHQREELDFGRGDLFGLQLALGVQPFANRRDDVALDAIPVCVVLDERIAERHQPRLGAVASQHIAEAHFVRSQAGRRRVSRSLRRN